MPGINIDLLVLFNKRGKKSCVVKQILRTGKCLKVLRSINCCQNHIFKAVLFKHSFNLPLALPCHCQIYLITFVRLSYLFQDIEHIAFKCLSMTCLNQHSPVTYFRAIIVGEVDHVTKHVHDSLKVRLRLTPRNNISDSLLDCYYLDSKPSGLFDCHRHESSHISLIPLFASQPISILAFVGSA